MTWKKDTVGGGQEDRPKKKRREREEREKREGDRERKRRERRWDRITSGQTTVEKKKERMSYVSPSFGGELRLKCLSGGVFVWAE